MTSFAALMALSASQTKQSEAQVQSQLEERKRREAQKRKELEEKERKDREMEQKLRKRALEEAQRAKEREERLEAERRAKELALKKKEDEQRDALRYGPKKARAEYPSSSSAARDELRRRRMPESDDETGGSALTREEKRQMRLQRELNYGAGSSRRNTTGYRKNGRRLAGGAVDVDATASSGNGANSNYRSVRERIAHEPPGLIKLNVNKRDTRTIDEILQDRAKAKTKTLAGEEARTFGDWFGKSKAKASSTAPPSSPSSIFSSRSPSPVHAAPPEGSKAVSRASKSLSGTPPVVPQPSATSKPALTGLSFLKNNGTPPTKGSGVTVKSVGGRPVDKPSANGAVASSKFTNGRMPTKAGVAVPSKPATSFSARPPLNAAKQAGSSAKLGASTGSFRKRPRSPSLTPSPPPAKRRSAPPGGGGNSISAEIWKLFGKDRNAYVARDVYSDDEDMEAGAHDLESEELYRSVICKMNSQMEFCNTDANTCIVPGSLGVRTSWLWKKRSVMRRRSVGRGRRRRGEVEPHNCTPCSLYDHYAVCLYFWIFWDFVRLLA